MAFEFDRWTSSTRGAPHDRLDVLGLDEAGVLVIAELKREEAPDPTTMQAIKYAAMASRFTPETLASNTLGSLRSAGQRRQRRTLSAFSRLMLKGHSHRHPASSEGRPARPFLSSASHGYGRMAQRRWEIVTLMRFQAYQADTQIVVSVSQLYPVAEEAEFTVTPDRHR